MKKKLLHINKQPTTKLIVLGGLGTIILICCVVWILTSVLRGTPVFGMEGSFRLKKLLFKNIVEQNSSGKISSIFSTASYYEGIRRTPLLRTISDPYQRHTLIEYTVEKGDSIFKISKDFNLLPETILWANYETLKDNPELLSIGMTLKIPPTDGIYYEWKSGDSIEDVAAKFKVKPSSILLWPENGFDQDNLQINEGIFIMIPDGKREMVSWVMPTIPRKNSGVTKMMAGPGGCETNDGAYGTGSFIWPGVNDYLSGNDFWSGHLALDIASGLGSPIYASDSGLVVYAGWNNSGYGNMVMIDHGNGYQTLYAHLNQVSVTCGSSVYQGTFIGSSGSTGNSTGPHLHFEIRKLGGLVNPWSFLP
ncbi:MAG: hypothetical protein CVU42_15810 [Chloroflexi bacterium HGW-Chloroflexi-4]|jgi:LysM repeat protein|nr:MAG: hypothetical protein CVU42_15810 [Chloroflexi bacterium HGW-Chloroflexi-4]